ncbi:hypothetical protein ACN47E_009252 [Coniothyrium glycines]
MMCQSAKRIGVTIPEHVTGIPPQEATNETAQGEDVACYRGDIVRTGESQSQDGGVTYYLWIERDGAGEPPTVAEQLVVEAEALSCQRIGLQTAMSRGSAAGACCSIAVRRNQG